MTWHIIGILVFVVIYNKFENNFVYLQKNVRLWEK